ncbi:hypothetical protein HARCEL1_12715 [Halococcoides cellulosivorans]|uniref:Uncharacterized protein n=1 Tax=Halococcoides cellulosivorans TaxID=1679096 RepID=A0A2R4X4L0_9EURY|nr:hypothetical protein HARCEL1_12715 [Halococcoides cellulosivorans]
MRNRLDKEPGCHDVRVRPSRARPRSILARVTPSEFLGQGYAIDEATLTVRFSYPNAVDYEYYVIEWSEEERDLGIGWHQDEDHPDLGECHFQIDHAGQTVDRRSATFLNDHPLEVLETRLDQLRAVLPRIEWAEGAPTVPDDGLPPSE